MAKIKKPSIFDKKRLKKTVSFLNKDTVNLYFPTTWPFNVINELTPLPLKTQPETFVLVEDKDILGSISIFFHKGNPRRINIGRLFFEQEYMDVGKQLINYIVSKYGANGATNFFVKIEETQKDLINLFVKDCGFRQCLTEETFLIDKDKIKSDCKEFFRPFKNSDAQTVTDIYNGLLITHFKPSLSKIKKEFIEAFFTGLQANYTMRFVLEDKILEKVVGYLKITSTDNKNFLIDITKDNWFDSDYEDFIAFAKNQISHRTKNFNLLVRVKKYKTNAQYLEDFLREKEAKSVENKVVLVKDFYKLIKDRLREKRLLIFNETETTAI